MISMKHRITALIASVLLLAAFLLLEQYCRAPMPEPSVPGGYYYEEFVLHFTAPENGTIYYTLDGSVPTDQSAVYTDGIHMANRSSEPNVYNAVQNVVPEWKNYNPDPTPVAKGTVVRAIYISDWGFASDIFTQTYFVGISPPEQGYTLSLIFSYDDFFGDKGIYVTGADYDAWYLSGKDMSLAPLPNYEQHWEVPALAQMMDNTQEIMNQTVGIRIQGASARPAAKKRLTMTARKEYSGSQTFDVMIFDGITTHSVMMKEALIDAIMPELVADRHVSVQRSVPVRVFLNGEYWYDSFILERYDSQYFRQYYQVPEKLLVKDGVPDPEVLAISEVDDYGEFMYWVCNSDLSQPENWKRLQQEADIQSYIDFLAINCCIGNYDFHDEHNYVLWRSLYPGHTKFEDQRWRWCLYDLDTIRWAKYDPSFDDHAALNIFSDPGVYGIANTKLFRALRNNPEFCRQFVLSYSDIVNNNFAPKRVEAVLSKYGYTLDWLDSFFTRRPAFAMAHLADEFDLTGTLETVHISTADPQMGTVTVNTSQIDLSDGRWSGQYYSDYPITITVAPEPGYTFVGWKGDTGETSAQITLPVTGGLSLEAVFAKA